MTEEWFKCWLASKRSFVKPSTLAQYRRICRKVILPVIQSYGIERGSKILEEKLPERYKPKTVKDIALVANQLLKFGFEKGFVLDLYRIEIKTQKQKNTRVQVLNRYEQEVFMKYLLHDLNYSKLGVLLSLCSGLRLGEICALQVKDIDLNAKIIRVSKTVQRIYEEDGTTFHHFGTPKTETSKREIPLPEFLSQLAIKLLRELPKDYYVATGTKNFVQPRTYQNQLKSHFRKCNLGEYHFHILRHTFATRAVELGFDIKSLSEILGHANVKITLNLYVHPSMEQKRAEMEKLSALIQS